MAQETTKAMRRRWREDAEGGTVLWKQVFEGRGIDVGSGDDPLSNDPNIMDRAQPFDRQHGDAERLSCHFAAETFDFVHASQVLEHMADPFRAVMEWLAVLKPGGHLIVTVPDWVAYEGMVWPSRWNSDHKSTWSMIYRGSAAPLHVHIPTFLGLFSERLADVLVARFVDTNYDYKVGTTRDQTLPSDEMVECWNEFVLRKK